MPRTIFNEGRVVGYSAYEEYIRHFLEQNPNGTPASEKEWLSSTIAMGTSMLLRVEPDTTDGAHYRDIQFPTNSILCAANTIMGNPFLGAGSGSPWVTKVTDYGTLISNTDSSSPSGNLGPNGNVPRGTIAQLTTSMKAQLREYSKVLDGIIIHPGNWSNVSAKPPTKRLTPNMAQYPRIRLLLSHRITTAFYILLTGFTIKGVITGSASLDPPIPSLSPQNGDFLGPPVFPWSSKVMFATTTSVLNTAKGDIYGYVNDQVDGVYKRHPDGEGTIIYSPPKLDPDGNPIPGSESTTNANRVIRGSYGNAFTSDEVFSTTKATNVQREIRQYSIGNHDIGRNAGIQHEKLANINYTSSHTARVAFSLHAPTAETEGQGQIANIRYSTPTLKNILDTISLIDKFNSLVGAINAGGGVAFSTTMTLQTCGQVSGDGTDGSGIIANPGTPTLVYNPPIWRGDNTPTSKYMNELFGGHPDLEEVAKNTLYRSFYNAMFWEINVKGIANGIDFGNSNWPTGFNDDGTNRNSSAPSGIYHLNNPEGVLRGVSGMDHVLYVDFSGDFSFGLYNSTNETKYVWFTWATNKHNSSERHFFRSGVPEKADLDAGAIPIILSPKTVVGGVDSVTVIWNTTSTTTVLGQGGSSPNYTFASWDITLSIFLKPKYE